MANTPPSEMTPHRSFHLPFGRTIRLFAGAMLLLVTACNGGVEPALETWSETTTSAADEPVEDPAAVPSEATDQAVIDLPVSPQPASSQPASPQPGSNQPAPAVATATTQPTATSQPTPTQAAPPAAPTNTPDAGTTFGIIDIAPGDPDGGLVIHASAGLTTPEIGVAPQGSVVTATGNAATASGSTWFEVAPVLNTGLVGWVNASWLTPLPSFTDLACGDATQYSATTTSIAGTSNPSTVADEIVAIHELNSDECHRVVITLGGQTANSSSASASPDVTVTFDGEGHLVTSFGTTGDSITSVRPEATQLNGLWSTSVVARDTQSAGAQVHSYYGSNREMRVTLQADPARVVIDTIAVADIAPVALHAAPAAAIETVQVQPGQQSLTIRGYARTFEASAEVRLRTGGTQTPGLGAPVVMGQVSVNGQTLFNVDSFGAMTNDWLDMWGQWEFTIESPLQPGIYELFVGSSVSGQEAGVYYVFTIS